jgi:hypothetical protein
MNLIHPQGNIKAGKSLLAVAAIPGLHSLQQKLKKIN